MPKPVAEAPKSTVLKPSGTPKGPSDIEMGPGMKACQPDDNSPAGTVVGKYRKVVSHTPFGAACRWESIE